MYSYATLSTAPAGSEFAGLARGIPSAAGLRFGGLQVHVFHGGIVSLEAIPDRAIGEAGRIDGNRRRPATRATATRPVLNPREPQGRGVALPRLRAWMVIGENQSSGR
jgi:hypothetical protein